MFRFRCLLHHRTLHYNPAMAAKIIIACCVLHNMCKKLGDDCFDDDIEISDVEDDENEIYHNIVRFKLLKFILVILK